MKINRVCVKKILYAFLSDNFKKSFLKACTCATGRDANAALHIENSVFPRRNKPKSDSHRAGGRGGGFGIGGPGTTAIEGCGTSTVMGGMRETSTTALTMTSRSNVSDNRFETTTTAAVLAPVPIIPSDGLTDSDVSVVPFATNGVGAASPATQV